ncbi:unnamed protein product [Symbiodinium necroappetens]|uniref:EF-hand domain-containing protein n=1 Tax=Symbiodinium necroappetens TaxID=1628268 RepID=A0A812Z8V9_9DINO|nr:unnamed protein product [Symbiodinium necroappetens]
MATSKPVVRQVDMEADMLEFALTRTMRFPAQGALKESSGFPLRPWLPSDELTGQLMGLLEDAGRSNSKARGAEGSASRRDSSFPATPNSEDATRRQRRQELNAKVQAARALQLARQHEIRVGEEWSELLKVPSNRTPDAMMNFWEEVKMRLLKRFGSLHAAIQSSGESSVSFLKFSDLLKAIHFPLNQSTCRHLFGQVCGGHREMPVDSFKALLMERTIQSMRFVMEGWNGKQVRLQSHIRSFIRRLCEVSTDFRAQAVDRFQRKLQGSFLRDFWQLLLKRLGSTRSEDLTVTTSSLLRVLVDPEATLIFQDHEVLYMLRIFERMQTFRRSLGLLENALPLCHYLAGLALVSGMTKREKLTLIFEAFDSDYDHCLLYSQVHEMCHCICVLKARSIESALPRGRPAEDHFQAELSQQEGLRWYESIRWHLQRSGSVHGDIVSLPELFEALDTQPGLLLMPGVCRIRWAAEAAPGEDLEEAVRAAAAELRQARRSGAQPWISQSSAKEAPCRHCPDVQHLWHTAGNEAIAKGVEETEEAEMDWRSFEKGPPCGKHSESYIFKTVLTERFAKSLRDLGSQRLVRAAGKPGLAWEHRWLQEQLTQPAPSVLDLSPAPARVPSLARASSAPSLAAPKAADGGRGGPGPFLAFCGTAAAAAADRVRCYQERPPARALELSWGPPLAFEAADRFRIYAAANTGESQDLRLRQRRDFTCGNLQERVGGAVLPPDQARPWADDALQAASPAHAVGLLLPSGIPRPSPSPSLRCKLCLRSHKLCPGHDILK